VGGNVPELGSTVSNAVLRQICRSKKVKKTIEALWEAGFLEGEERRSYSE